MLWKDIISVFKKFKKNRNQRYDGVWLTIQSGGNRKPVLTELFSD